MSVIEETAKPFLIPLFTCGRTLLDDDAQRAIAEWAILKLMALEKAKPDDAVFLQSQRTAFYERREAPAQTYIYIMDCEDGPRLSPMFSQAVSVFEKNIPENDLTKKNMKLVTLSFGYLVIVALYSTEVEIDPQFAPPTQIIRIHPPSRPKITWPPLIAAKASTIEFLSGVIDRLKGTPNVKIIPLS